MDTSAIPLGQPLVDAGSREPVAYPALGAILHLESLTADDEERLRRATQLVAEWIGPQLRHTENSTFSVTSPYESAALEYIPGYAKTLTSPSVPPDVDVAHVLNCIYASTFGQFSIYFTGADAGSVISPYSLDFSMEMYERNDGGPLYTCGVFKVTVPMDWPLEDFRRRVRQLVEALPLRWGAAGFTYSAWLTPLFQPARRTIYAHARRHPGFDIGQTEAFAQEWHREMRSVNWLTYVGGTFASSLREAKVNLVSTRDYTVSAIGSTLELQAGPTPSAGDTNRLDIPPAYAHVDRLVRPIRARAELDFTDPWTTSTSTEWLRRFERP